VPSIVLPFKQDGPIVDVEIGWSSAEIRAARRAGRPIPPPVQGLALIDTGAEGSCLDSSLIRQLGLPYGGITMVNVPASGGLVFSPSHDANVVVRHPSGVSALNLILADVFLYELDLGLLGYQALLGRDLLASCRLLYDGPGGRFKLRY
jgi:hypothetical protein